MNASAPVYVDPDTTATTPEIAVPMAVLVHGAIPEAEIDDDKTRCARCWRVHDCKCPKEKGPTP